MEFVLAVGFGSLALASGLLFIDYRRWRRSRLQVERSFARARTSIGEVPYLDEGPREGPVVLFVPGGGAGIDLLHAFPWLPAAGFRVAAVRRGPF